MILCLINNDNPVIDGLIIEIVVSCYPEVLVNEKKNIYI